MQYSDRGTSDSTQVTNKDLMQFVFTEMSLLSFNHLLNLSFNFHTHRKTGEVLRILDRGAAINHTFELILFSIIPTFVDIAVALVFFCVYFEWTLALVIFFVMAAYGMFYSQQRNLCMY